MKHRLSTIGRLAAAAQLSTVVALCACAALASGQPLFLVDPASTPRVEIAWPVRGDGDLHGSDTSLPAEPALGSSMKTLSGDRPYSSDAERQDMGANISAFVAVGGTRMRMGAGHARAASIKVGFYKIDPAEPFFTDLTTGGAIRIRLSNLRFNDEPAPLAISALQHMKYDEGDLKECGISSTARNQFNLASPTDTLNSRARPGIDTRMGVLDGSEETDGLVRTWAEPDGSVSMEATVPYWLLRHLSDPWRTDIPGTFIEPYHFHIEFEVIPVSVAEQQGGSDDEQGSSGGRAVDNDTEQPKDSDVSPRRNETPPSGPTQSNH